MGFKNFLIVASKLDKAGINITTNLSQYSNEKFKFYLIDRDITNSQQPEDLEKYNNFDFIIFASKHQSKEPTKTLSIHTPGNFLNTPPLHGGDSGKISMSSALFLKQAFKKLRKNTKENNLDGYQVTLEATHHGPSINKPCFFIEIGSTENEWADRRAGFVVAKTISDIINSYQHNPYNEITIGIGGPHYCPNFNKLQLYSNFAISHIIPQYCLPVTEVMIKETLSKTFEEYDLILLDWKGLGNSESRQQVINVLDKLHLRYEKIGDLNKED